jgi:hypothetical protein
MVRSRKYTHGEEVKERERDEKQETRNKRRETRDEKRGMKARDESEGDVDGERV